MNELSLFTGAGGGVLGSKLLGHRIIGYVEYEPYCQEILKQRISDGILDAAPIFSDIRAFIRDGYAIAYQGMVDLISGGFPCQPFSVAGKGLGEADPRNMWPFTIKCVRIIRPRFIFLENVPGLLTDPYIRRIFGDLAESGYDTRWTCLGADDVGANHRRKRLWILAYSTSSSGGIKPWIAQNQRTEVPSGLREERRSLMADANNSRESQPSNEGEQKRHRAAVKRWPTPRGPKRGPDPKKMERENRTSPTDLETAIGGQLNPPWVEWLMGWPVGWTDLKPLETDKYLSQWLTPFQSYLKELSK